MEMSSPLENGCMSAILHSQFWIPFRSSDSLDVPILSVSSSVFLNLGTYMVIFLILSGCLAE